MEKIPVRTLQSKAIPANPGDFRVLQIRILPGEADMVQPLHRHDFYYILAIEKGSGLHEIDFTTYTVQDRSLFFMRPGQVHQLQLHAGTQGYLLQFPAAFYYPDQPASRIRLRKAATINACTCAPAQFAPLQYALETLWQEYNNRQEDFVEMIKAQLSVFLVGLIRLQDAHPDRGSSYQQEQSEAFLDLLEQHITTHKQAGQYATLLHLSGAQLSTITQTILGKTPSALIRDQVILEARRRLLATSRQVGQVADDLGYEDVSYFIRLFRKHTGYTPEAFRRQRGG